MFPCRLKAKSVGDEKTRNLANVSFFFYSLFFTLVGSCAYQVIRIEMIDCRVVSTFRVEAGKKAETKITNWRTNQPRTTIV